MKQSHDKGARFFSPAPINNFLYRRGNRARERLHPISRLAGVLCLSPASWYSKYIKFERYLVALSQCPLKTRD